METAIQIYETEAIPALEGSKTLVGDNDRVFIKKLWKFPVPTNYELNLFLGKLEDTDPLKIGFALMLITGARPVEIVRMRWDRFIYDEQNNIFTQLLHETYKPSNRASKTGRNYYFKQVKKDVGIKSQWINELLHKYQQKCPGYDHNRLFPFTSPDSFNKYFCQLRKKVKKGELPHDYKCFIDQNIEQLKGCDSKTQYRISLYSFRRFAITFMYWSKKPVGFDQDIVALSRYIGHTNPKTTYEHYVLPKEAIGLTETMIKECITIDQFIKLAGACQSQLTEFTEKPKYRFIPKGQTTLDSF